MRLTFNEIVALSAIAIPTLALIIDIGIRVIGYTSNRQRDFYTLTQRVALLEETFSDYDEERTKILREFRDVQGIIKKAGLYTRDTDSE